MLSKGHRLVTIKQLMIEYRSTWLRETIDGANHRLRSLVQREITMKKTLMHLAAFAGLTFVVACSTTEIPDQQSVDTCRDSAGIETSFIVETSPTGERSLKTDPPGSTVPVKEAIAFENCLKSIS